MRRFLLYLLLVLLQGCLCRSSPFPHNFTVWRWVSSTVGKNWIYLDGGEVCSNSHGSGNTYALHSTLAVDLTKSWTNQTISFQTRDKPTDFALARKPKLWYNPVDDSLNTCGGWLYGASEAWSAENGLVDVTNDLEKLFWECSVSNAPLGGEWTTSNNAPPTHGSVVVTVENVQGAILSTNGSSAFLFGGVSVDDQLFAQRGLVEYAFASKQWTNTSNNTGYGIAPGQDPNIETIYGSWAESVHIPDYGDSGILIMIGGYNPSSPYTATGMNGSPLQPMSIITVYDIASGVFTTQQATGEIPLPRWTFCAAVVKDSLTGGYDIFVHGGSPGAESSQPYDDSYAVIYALSIPSFIWSIAQNSLAPNMRAFHTCEIVGNRQLMIVGGQDPGLEEQDTQPDVWPNAIGIYDVSAMQWASSYNPTAGPYQRSSSLAALNNKTPYPATWDSVLLHDIFQPVAPSGNHTGAIVGGIVGGLAALLVVVGGLYFWRKRKRSEIPYTQSPDGFDRSEFSSNGMRKVDLYNNDTYDPQYELDGQELHEVGQGARYEIYTDTGHGRAKVSAAAVEMEG